MLSALSKWYRQYFSDPEVIILCLTLFFSILLILLAGQMLAPVFASVVIAYLLQWLVKRLEKCKFPHWLAVSTVYMGFIGLLTLSLFVLLPLLWQQMSNLFNELPLMLSRGQELLMHLPQRYPGYITTEQLQRLLVEARLELTQLGHLIFSLSLASIPSLIMVSIYLILVPLLVYFLLMDKALILAWFAQYLPAQKRLLSQVWEEVHEQIGNYIGGKVVEILIVSLVCYLVFAFMGLHYATLLAALVGLSVVIPYLGGILVTLPITIIAFSQWGWSSYFTYFMLAYGMIMLLDGNVLVPLLFSEVVKLHPVAIICATLIFGNLWGFWGVFFAIPLASLVKAILIAWPKQTPLPRAM